jgi:hypothetical protein
MRFMLFSYGSTNETKCALFSWKIEGENSLFQTRFDIVKTDETTIRCFCDQDILGSGKLEVAFDGYQVL